MTAANAALNCFMTITPSQTRIVAQTATPLSFQPRNLRLCRKDCREDDGAIEITYHTGPASQTPQRLRPILPFYGQEPGGSL